MKIARSLPFFKALIKSPILKRARILRSFPSYVVDDLCEVLYNIVTGRVKLGGRPKKTLMKYKKALLALTNARSKPGRRNVIYKQKGGFLGALVPIITSLAAGLLKQFA